MVKSLVGDKFDQEKFDQMKDSEGFITKTQLIEAISASTAAAAADRSATDTTMNEKQTTILQNNSRFPLGDGNTIPCIGFGTYQIKEEDVVDPVTMALDIGYRHIDTAEIYNNEIGVGIAIKKWIEKSDNNTRESLFITTKLWPGNPNWGMEPKTYETTIESCKNSLKKLDIDQIDLYLIHTPLGGSKEDRLNQYRGLIECQQTLGLCKSIGVSNYGIKHLIEIEEAGLPLPTCNQLEIHPFCTKLELINYMKLKNISVIAYSSLAPLSSWRLGQQSAKSDDKRLETSPFMNIVNQHNQNSDNNGENSCNESNILLRWALQKEYAILPKSIHYERILNNFNGPFNDSLTADEMNYLNGLDRNEFLAFGNSDQPFDPTTAP